MNLGEVDLNNLRDGKMWKVCLVNEEYLDSCKLNKKGGYTVMKVIFIDEDETQMSLTGNINQF